MSRQQAAIKHAHRQNTSAENTRDLTNPVPLSVSLHVSPFVAAIPMLLSLIRACGPEARTGLIRSQGATRLPSHTNTSRSLPF